MLIEGEIRAVRRWKDTAGRSRARIILQLGNGRRRAVLLRGLKVPRGVQGGYLVVGANVIVKGADRGSRIMRGASIKPAAPVPEVTP